MACKYWFAAIADGRVPLLKVTKTRETFY